MEKYAVVVGPSAKREIKKLSKQTQRRIVKCLETLIGDPRPPGVEKLSQNPRFWRIRTGDYRIIYSIDSKEGVITILIVRHRRAAYRDLDTLESKLASVNVSDLAALYDR